MPDNRVDRRIQRTRQLLTNALVDLMFEKRYDAITVQDIIDRADVGRSTFYSHFRDKEDLLQYDFESLLNELSQHLEDGEEEANKIVPSLGLFRHAQEFHRLYRILIRGRGLELHHKTGHDFLRRSCEERLNSLLVDNAIPPVPVPIVANYLAGALLESLKWWLDHDMPYSPERMNEMFLQLVMPGVWSALGIEPKA